jgi:hypothetical protein
MKFRLNDVNIQIDNVLSVGASWRVADRNTNLLPSANGGREDLRAAVDPSGLGDCGTMEAPSAYAKTNGTVCIDAVSGVDNYDSSINSDDGRLNFDKGDITGGTIKLLTDIEASSGPLKMFVRLNSFYDAALSNDGSFERYAPTSDAKRDLLQDIEVLDAYVDWSGDIAGNPLQVRLGKQVINWGESTFYLGGNAVQPSVSVGALRRPGAEIKEALLPVEALYASLALPYDLTLEAYAGLGHRAYILDVGGSPFANSDVANLGSGGNGDKAFIGGGFFSGAQRVNCTPTTGGFAGLDLGVTERIHDILDGKGLLNCADGANSYQHFGTRLLEGHAEKTRLEYGDKYYLTMVGDLNDPHGNDFGLALRWYSEALNSTEFGFYYQNYTSQIPYVSTVSHGPAASWTTVGSIGKTGRALTNLGCGLNAGSDTALGYFSGAEAANRSETETLADILTRLNNTVVADPNGLMDAYRGDAKVGGSLSALNAVAADGALGSSIKQGSALEMQALICSSHYASIDDGTTLSGLEGAAAGLNGLGVTGLMAPVIEPIMSLGLSYPENIDLYGFSFNTTLGSWGVQGEVAYRPDMPLQIDTDELTVGALGGSCSGRSYVALADSLSFGMLGVTNGFGSQDHFNSKGILSCSDERQVYEGWIYNEALTFDVGTTATYTRSNPIVDALSADLLVLLTEVNVVHVPGIEGDYKDGLSTLPGSTLSSGQRGTTPLANACTSGTDIGLAALFSLDIRGNKQCRPTDTSSSGLVMLQLQYNNVFGTAWGLTPTFVYQEDLDGIAPSPLAGFKEGNKRQSFSLGASFQSTTINLSYTQFDGEEIYSRDDDKDFVSLSFKQGF